LICRAGELGHRLFFRNEQLDGLFIVRETRGRKSLSLGGAAMIATAIVAVGACAIDALAVGWLVALHLSIDRTQLNSLEIENLTVRRLYAAEVVVSDSLTVPERKAGFRKL
jgi:hypothetical protein